MKPSLSLNFFIATISPVTCVNNTVNTTPSDQNCALLPNNCLLLLLLLLFFKIIIIIITVQRVLLECH